MERRLGQKLQTFRIITNDYGIEQKQLVKFINWGKGDLEQALNYYYRHLEKNKLSNTSNSNNINYNNNNNNSKGKGTRNSANSSNNAHGSNGNNSRSASKAKASQKIANKKQQQIKQNKQQIKQSKQEKQRKVPAKPQTSRNSKSKNQGIIIKQYSLIDIDKQSNDSPVLQPPSPNTINIHIPQIQKPNKNTGLHIEDHHQAVDIEQDQREREREYDQISDDIIINSVMQSGNQFEGGEVKDAFAVLRKGSVKQKKTHDFIKNIRQIYKLPIRGKPQPQLQKQSKQGLQRNRGKMADEFKMVDHLPDAFNQDKINQILLNKANMANNNKINTSASNSNSSTWIKNKDTKKDSKSTKSTIKQAEKQEQVGNILDLQYQPNQQQLYYKQITKHIKDCNNQPSNSNISKNKQESSAGNQCARQKKVPVQLSVSDSSEQQQFFKDIDQYQYKLVYKSNTNTKDNIQKIENKQISKNQQNFKIANMRDLEQIQSSQRQEQLGQDNDDGQPKNNGKIRDKNYLKSNGYHSKQDQALSRNKPNNNKEMNKPKNKSKSKTKNEIKVTKRAKQKQKQSQIIQNSIQEQAQSNKQEQISSSMTQNGKNQRQLSIKQIIFSPKYALPNCIQQKQIYVGQYVVRAFCTQKRRFDPQLVGKQVKVTHYIEPLKAHKRNFGKNTQRNMNMRISLEGRLVGRINDDQVRIIMPLIDQGLIRIQFFFKQVPIIGDVFKTILLIGKVYIQSKLITQPILENYEPQQQDKDRVHQISGLLTKLHLPIITQPLIKAKSKYIKQQSKKQRQKQRQLQLEKQKQRQKQKKSFDRYPLTQYQRMQYQLLLQQKNRMQLNRIKTDFNYKQKQQSLREIIHKNQQYLKQKIISSNSKNQNHDSQQIPIDNNLVKKKVIQIDNQAQKTKLSELIDLHEENCMPYYPQNNFKSQLYEYQALALAWMLKRQGFLDSDKEKQQLNPLWAQYQIPNNEKYRLYFNQLTAQLCVKRPVSVAKCKGGILADQMGLGKTVMMTALIVTNPPKRLNNKNQNQQENQDQKSLDFGYTVVIVPLTLLSQWQSQIARHASNQKVIIYYSSQRKKIANSLGKYDVVLTTYGTVSHQFAQGLHNKKTGIFKYKWHRIILDQAHYIKGRIIQTSKAIYQLKGTYRWCLTGTPIQNNVTDIFSLLHFIKYTPWSQFVCWNRFIVKPMEEQDQSVYQALRAILKQIFLRRTKNSQGPNGKQIIQLPHRVSKIQLLEMSTKQRQFYDSIYKSSRSDFDSLIQKGILEAKYMQVLQILMRLRQICCHPILFKSITKYTKNVEQFENELKKLVKRSQKRRISNQSQSQDQYYEPIIDADNQQYRIKTNNNIINQEYLNQVLEKVASQSLDCCIICLQPPEDPVINCCLHIFCKGCNIRQIQQKGSCAFCRRQLTKQDFIYLPRQNRMNIKKDNQNQGLFLSTKMIALNEHLSKLNSDDKVVIFSQFLGMLDLLEGQLKKNKYSYVRMQGSNSHKQRTRIVKSFQQDKQVKIFLVSLKTAGVGLNLVAANKVFLIDPWWNPAVQEQAIQRVHRIGQKRPVQIIRFIMDKTIETRMLQLNTEKKALSQNILNQNQDKDNNSRQKIQKLKYLMENY